MSFSILVILLIAIVIWVDFRNPLWRKLSARFKTKWIPHNIFTATTLYLWDTEEKRWVNHVYIDITEKGLGIYPPFFKRYMNSLLIPWDEIKIDGRVYKGIFQGLKLDIFSRLQVSVSASHVTLAIPYKFNKIIEQFKKGGFNS